MDFVRHQQQLIQVEISYQVSTVVMLVAIDYVQDELITVFTRLPCHGN
jgi:hypothetical protein